MSERNDKSALKEVIEMSGLDKKVALVTGGSSGIGRAAALAFAREGARVVIADLKVDGGEETQQMIQETGGKAMFIRTDVTKSDEVEALVDTAVQTYGQLDCAFNNAGIGGRWAVLAQLAERDWERVISVNLKGVWLCMKYEIPQMVKQGKGAIVNTASVAGLIAVKGSSAAAGLVAPQSSTAAYVASKHGVVGLTKAAAIEYATAGIRVNAVCPGVIHTPMIDPFMATRPEMEATYRALAPLGRLGNAEEVAEAVVWLCSDAASFVTGHPLAVDGGLVAW